MRRKGADVGMKFLGPRVMSALQVWLWLLLFIFQNEFSVSNSAEPGYLDFDNLPETNFSCAGKVIGGYYADLETDCQMFHVCTIGQLEEPMDIKFLCLNGTVFDQETRVCERVDEVDCSKSEHFYSLNLELYGNTAPPIIKADTSTDEEEEGEEEDYEEVYDETTTPKSTTIKILTTSTTKKPSPTTQRQYHTTRNNNYYHTTAQTFSTQSETSSHPDDDNYESIDYNDNKESSKTNSSHHEGNHFQHFNGDSQLPRPLPTLANQPKKTNDFDDELNANEESSKTKGSDGSSQIFSPQDFIYHHNKQTNPSRKAPAISFQQQSFSSGAQNSHVTVTTHTGRENYNSDAAKDTNSLHDNPQISRTYLTSSTPHSDIKSYIDKAPTFNNYQPFNTPKRAPLIPTPNTQGQIPTGHPGLPSPKHQNEPLYFSFNKPSLTPQGFKSSQNSQANLKQNIRPINKLSAKPFQSYQPSERHEVSVDTEYDFEKLTPTYPFIHQDFSQYHYDHKRSQEPEKYKEKSSSDNNSETTTLTSTPYYNTWATRHNNYTKSLPRVIVTASASVSDSNGKKLNYTVGNILHAVKPIVSTNYDNYKESDVLLDPFFLDVPKLKMVRRKRSNEKEKKNLTPPSKKTNKLMLEATIYPIEVTTNTTENKVYMNKESSNENLNPKTPPWTPPDYVDDNYEPVVFPFVSVNNDDEKNHYLKSKIKDDSEKEIKHQAPPNENKTIHNSKFMEISVKALPIMQSTTENNIAKTTLEIAQIESTTISFRESTINPYAAAQNITRFNLTSVNIVKMSEQNSSSVNFSCKGKKYYKFYPDKTDCRTFHFCSPGTSSLQVLDTVFKCDLDTFFNHRTMSCTTKKPNDCEL